MTVTVYSSTHCSWCVKTKEHLDSINVPYESINISEDREAARKVFELTRQTGVPVTRIGERCIVGYDPDAIDSALRDAQLI